MSNPDNTSTSVRTLWGEYPNTVLDFQGPIPARIDLREPIASTHCQLLVDLGLEQSFGILTAENPCGKTHSSAQNAEYAAQLCRELEASGIPYVTVDAHSPDHTHSEASVAVPLTRDAVVALAIRYDQLAIFWFDGQRFWLFPATVSYPPLPLPAL